MKIYFVVFIIFLFVSNEVFAVPGTEKGIASLDPKFQAEAREIKAKLQKNIYRLDIEDQSNKAIYSKPGIDNSDECKQDVEENKKNPKQQCKSIGWPDNKADIVPTGKLEFIVLQDKDGNDVLYSYTQVDFKYTRNGKAKSGRGWISQDFLSSEPVLSPYSEIKVEKKEAAIKQVAKPADCGCKPKSFLSNLADLAKTSNTISENVDKLNTERKNVNDIAKELSGKVGECVLNPPNKAPKDFKGELFHDRFVLPKIKQMPVPTNIKKENSQNITQQDLVDIDALARSINAEMAICVPMGTRYTLAVARVIKNREMLMTRKPVYMSEFLRFNDQHDPSKSLISKAATSPVMISAWNREIIDFDALTKARAARSKELQKTMSVLEANTQAKRDVSPNEKSNPKAFYKFNESGLLHTLCPPADPNKKCYTGVLPDKNASVAWDNALKVATEAILFPNQFLRKTAELEGVLHYTSDRSSFYNFTEVKPSIEGKKIDNKRCLNLWKNPAGYK